METETEKEAKGGCPECNCGDPDIVSPQEQKILSQCPECGGPLRFGSRDLAEGDYWWCSVCGYGPIKFPLFCGPPVKQVGVKEMIGIIDADKANEALRTVAILKAKPSRKRLVITEEPVPGYKPASPHVYLDEPLDNLGNWKNWPEVH